MSAPRLQRHMRRIIRLSLFALLLVSGWALAGSFRVDMLQAQSVEGRYLAEANISYTLSAPMLEALQSGVPLTFQVHLQLRRQGAWLWVSDLVDKRLRYQIRYQALAGVYQVLDLQTRQVQRFATREAALIALGTLRDIEVVEVDRLEAGVTYDLALRSRLDIEALPLPLRPMAYLSPAWNLSSEWSVWLLKD